MSDLHPSRPLSFFLRSWAGRGITGAALGPLADDPRFVNVTPLPSSVYRPQLQDLMLLLLAPFCSHAVYLYSHEDLLDLVDAFNKSVEICRRELIDEYHRRMLFTNLGNANFVRTQRGFFLLVELENQCILHNWLSLLGIARPVFQDEPDLANLDLLYTPIQPRPQAPSQSTQAPPHQPVPCPSQPEYTFYG
ncbi:hypothetical protein M436DRAFT_78203 [Aureobasidium namibiae CBS 147.97]|uniref:Uncharacterized protein n=1 Tax=Aureobasidium namibiae CBS 147.97 TaxID=1043004 RepID=A0A074X361_9PEZI